jgi:hypothetical protein
VSFEGFFSVKKESVGVVGLVDLCKQLLAYPHHLGIEITNPVHLDGLVGKRGLATHLVVADDDGAFHSFALMLWHHAKNQTEHFIGWKKGLVPEEFKFPDQVHFAIDMLENLVDLRELNKKPNWLSLVKGEVNQPRI